MHNKKKVIIDTDLGIGKGFYFPIRFIPFEISDVDDALALIMAINSPELEIMGITSVYGNTTLKRVNRFIKQLLEVWEKSTHKILKFQSYSGTNKQIKKFPSNLRRFFYLKGQGIIENINQEEFQTHPIIKQIREGKLFPAIKFMADMIIKYPNEIILVPIGPLTNVALLFKIYPELIPKIKMISMMGGSKNSWEFNVANDPIASTIVYKSKVKTELAGFEICEMQRFSVKSYKKFMEEKTLMTKFLYKQVRSWLKFNISMRPVNKGVENPGFFPYDSCAIINLTHPELVKHEKIPVRHRFPRVWYKFNTLSHTIIEEELYRKKDELTEEEKSSWVDWGVDIDSEKFMEIFLERLKC
ncbi:MAG: hypothetical protein GY870_05850 [archaeon]|nr:hypothetical protein [archaeon]